ncbi:PfkB family carbohydrate kinase [Aestuariibius insulae]|uniref:PfkB family carbohydrate kinase n=1 Tax=Aestuariibius insulae TaxID=2058287 RepID=UPI00345ECD71
MSEIICIGSVLWDVIGRNPDAMPLGADRPGRITRLPGGVAMNIAMTLARLKMTPVLLTALGRDYAGDALVQRARELGMVTDHIHRSDKPTDTYMAIEAAGELTAAIADAHSLEEAGDAILAPLVKGPIATQAAPYSGIIALDGNLKASLLAQIAEHPAFAKADLRVAPASPGKIHRLKPFLGCDHATLYLNLEEANALSGVEAADANEALAALARGTGARILVTDGARAAAKSSPHGVVRATPPAVLAKRITGAGDTLMAAHIVAELGGATGTDALAQALQAAARYVSGEDL